MAYIESEIETGVRGYGRNQMRGLPRNLRPIVCSYQETSIYNHGARPSGSGAALPEMPRDGGTFGTSGNVHNDNLDHLLPCCQITARTHYRIGRLDAVEDLANKLKEKS